VVLDPLAEDVRDDRGPLRPQDGEPLLDEGADPDVLEADRVQHPRRSLDDARGRVPGPRGGGETLDDDPAETREVEIVLELETVAARPTRGQDRVLEAQAAADRGPEADAAHQATSAASKTGPSTQTRR